LRYVTIPQVLPALLAGALLVFGFIFSSYEVPALLGVGYPRGCPYLPCASFWTLTCVPVPKAWSSA
jgi:putative spermidine/putrescine transport system permease protein